MTKHKLEFAFLLGRHSKATLSDIQRLLRFATTHERIWREGQSHTLTEREQAKKIRLQRRVFALCSSFDAKPIFAAAGKIKLSVPDGHTNDMGREGIVIPA